MPTDRRSFVQGAACALAAGALAPHPMAFGQAAPATKAATESRTKLKVDCYSRHLQWLRSPDEVAEAAIEMAYQGVDVTVRPYPGHVDPEKVAQQLPAFVNAIRKHGLQVKMITCPITDATSPHAEAMLDAAASLDIHHYWWGTFRYEAGKPVMEQLDALKPRVEALAKLNEKYKMKAMYHTYSFANSVGCNVWDFLYVLRNFDPRYVSLHWDVGHTSLTGGNGTWAQSLRAAGPYIGGVSVKDYRYDLNLEVPEGGPFTGTPASLNQRSFGFGPNGPPPPGGPGGPPSGPLPPSQAAEQAAAERGMSAETPRAGGALAGARPGQADRPPLAGPGGRPATPPAGGAPGAAGPRGPQLPTGRGGGGQPNPWFPRAVPLGEGIDDLPLLCSVLREINFDGPIEIQAEYPNGGAQDAGDKITLPRDMVLGAMKRDLLTLKAAAAASGLL